MTVAFDFDAVRLAEAPRVRDGRNRLGAFLPPAADRTCVVVSADSALRRRLAAAAGLGGWDPDTSPVDASTLAAALRSDHELVVVDLVSPPASDREAVASFAREFAGRPDTMLVVCGDAADESHEVLARSLGAFAYVPGVAPGDDIVAVFREALVVADRRRGASMPASRSPKTAGAACARG